MRINIYYLVFIILFSLFYSSCTKETIENRDNYAYTLSVEDSIIIKIPDTIPVFNQTFNWSFNDESFSYLTETKYVFNIWVYHFKNKKFQKIIIDKFKVKINGKYCIKNNMIYYFPGYIGSFFKINFQGIIEEKYNYNLEKYSINFNNNPWNFYESEDEFIIPTSAVSSGMKYYKSLNLALIINKKESNLVKGILHFPDEYISNVDDSPSNLNGDFIFKKDSIIYSFQKSDYICLYTFNNNKVKKILAKNTKFSNTKIPKNLDGMTKAIMSFINGQYNSLLFDHFNNVYYRISTVFPEIINHVNARGIKKTMSDKNLLDKGIINIQVFDNNFNIIANVNFSTKDVSTSNYFINSEGLFLRSMYEPTPDNLVFKNLKLKKVMH